MRKLASFGFLLMGLIGLLIGSRAAALPTAQGQSQSEVQFAITGVGRVTLEPDFAIVVFTVQTISKTAQGAMNENARSVAALVKQLQAFVRRGDRIETAGFRLGPDRGGFFVFTQVQVRTTQVKGVGRLVDLAIRGGADEVTAVGFGREHAREAAQQAVREALERARENADAVAAGLGLRSIRVISIEPSLEELEGPMVLREADVSQARASNSQIQPGLLTLTARVTVRFVLAP